uniref:Uncharacterized protein n=1 Tax=Anguilla anguilla TaxID=7936 RepID=A0A0E9WF86_ANGAN
MPFYGHNTSEATFCAQFPVIQFSPISLSYVHFHVIIKVILVKVSILHKLNHLYIGI